MRSLSPNPVPSPWYFNYLIEEGVQRDVAESRKLRTKDEF